MSVTSEPQQAAIVSTLSLQNPLLYMTTTTTGLNLRRFITVTHHHTPNFKGYVK